jgi:hypothetical protein
MEVPKLNKLPSYQSKESYTHSRILDGNTIESLKDRVDRFKQLKKELNENESLMKVAEESQDFSLIPLIFEQHNVL